MWSAISATVVSISCVLYGPLERGRRGPRWTAMPWRCGVILSRCFGLPRWPLRVNQTRGEARRPPPSRHELPAATVASIGTHIQGSKAINEPHFFWLYLGERPDVIPRAGTARTAQQHVRAIRTRAGQNCRDEFLLAVRRPLQFHDFLLSGHQYEQTLVSLVQ